MLLKKRLVIISARSTRIGGLRSKKTSFLQMRLLYKRGEYMGGDAYKGS
jgi:hypothetical protein